MSKTKLTNLELNKWVTAGLGVSEIARKVGVSKGTVSKRLKSLNFAVTKDVTLHHAGEIVEMKLDAIGQLQKINDNANELLDLLMRWNRGDEEALQILERQVRKVKVGGEAGGGSGIQVQGPPRIGTPGHAGDQGAGEPSV